MNHFDCLRPWQPAHAKNLLRALLGNKGALDASDTGVGKTFSALAIARIFGCAPLVLGPKAVRSSWYDAAERMGVDIEFHNYEQARRDHVPHTCDSCDRSRSVAPRVLKHGGPPGCPACGQPMKPQPVDRLGIEIEHGSGSFWKWSVSPVMMVFDECHLCGGSTSITGKLLRSSTKAAEYVLCLSATAAENPGQMKNLGQTLGLFTGKDYWSWLGRNGFEQDYAGRLVMDEERVDSAMANINSLIFPRRGARLRRREIPGFPETLIDTLIIESDADLRDASKLMEAGDIASRMEARQKLEYALVDALPEYVEHALYAERTSVAVFLNFTESIDRLKKKFPWAGIIDGRQSGTDGDDERADLIRRFQSNSLDLMLVNNQAGGAGLSLHDPKGEKARTAFISPSESGRQMKQVVGRVWRDGGAFSRQFFLGLKDTPQEQNLQRNREKIRRIDILNGDEAEAIFNLI